MDDSMISAAFAPATACPQNHPHFTGQTWRLWAMGAAGRGMENLGAMVRGTDDWYLVALAFHEAGHAAAAREMGEVPWIIIDTPRSGRCRRTATRDHSRDEICDWGLSGAIAERLAVQSLDLGGTALQNQIELWPADARHAGAFDLRDVRRCEAMVKCEWAQVRATAAHVLARELARWSAST
jgi:hypothetical protein